MKKRTIIVFCLLIWHILTPAGLAVDVTERSFAIIDGESVEEAVPDSARELMGDAGIQPDLDFASCIKTLFSRAGSSIGAYVKQSLAGGLQLFAIAVLCMLASALTDKLQRAIGIAGTLAMMLVAAGDMGSLLGLGRTMVTEISAFGKVLMPVLAAASTASGAVASSGIVYVAVMFVIDLLIGLIADVMTPLVWAYIALLAAGGVTGNEGLFKLAKTLKNGVTCALKILLGLFVGYLMVGGVISGTTDAMTVKTVKLAMSSVIPVAGGVIADAAEAVVAGAGIVRSVTGIFGILSILAIAILPFLRLAVQYLMFRLSALLAAVSGAEIFEKLLEGLGDAFSLLLALTGSSAALLLIGVFVSAAGVTV